MKLRDSQAEGIGSSIPLQTQGLRVVLTSIGDGVNIL